MRKTTGVSDINGVQTGNHNACYRPYDESARATIKSSMASPQECVGGTQSTEVPGRDRSTVFPIAMEFSHITAVAGAVRILDRL